MADHRAHDVTQLLSAWRAGDAGALAQLTPLVYRHLQRLAHHATHSALYLLFFAVPLLGWAYSSATGFSVVLFGVLPLPDWVPVNESLADALNPAPRYPAYALAALVSLHVPAALKHHFIDRDGLLSRMGWEASSTHPSARTQDSS